MRRRGAPVRFRWIETNREHVAERGLSTEEVEFAWRRGLGDRRGKKGKYLTLGRTPSGRLIRIVWKHDEEFQALEPGHMAKVVFVITAYGIDL